MDNYVQNKYQGNTPTLSVCVSVEYFLLHLLYLCLLYVTPVYRSGLNAVCERLISVLTRRQKACICGDPNHTLLGDNVTEQTEAVCLYRPAAEPNKVVTCIYHLYYSIPNERMKNFNRRSSHGHHDSKHCELAQHALTWVACNHSHNYINTVTNTWPVRSAGSAITFQCMLGLFVSP